MLLKDINHIINSKFPDISVNLSHTNEFSLNVTKNSLIEICVFLKHDNRIKLEQLIDVCGVDYLSYGVTDWETRASTINGFSRARQCGNKLMLDENNRFCVVYNLLSYVYNFRLRLYLYVGLNDMNVPSVVSIWSTANWHECEVYDFFGVRFVGHPNLVKILTDYDFQGCPLRKDFPLSGEYEIRYDENKCKIIREPSCIIRKMNTPIVVRKDFRYK